MKDLPIEDRIKMAHSIKIESAKRNKLDLKVSWCDVHGKEQSQRFSVSAGSIIEFQKNLFFYFLTGGAWGAGVFIVIIYVILWIIQILSAASYCKQWNRAVAEGVIPW